MSEHSSERHSLLDAGTESALTRRDLMKLAAGATTGVVLSGCAAGAEAGRESANVLSDPIHYSSAKSIAAAIREMS